MNANLLATEADLFLTGVESHTHSRTVTFHVVGAVGVFLVGLIYGVSLGSLSTLAFILCVAGCIAVGLVLRPQRVVHRQAESIRRQLELATAVFLDLVNVLLAGGAGIETSIIAAANAGDGPGFSIIRLAVMKAQSARQSYWDSLAEIGQITDVPTLIEVAHTVQLAGEQGARIRTSLSSKAVALRKRNLARVEHDEEQRTEKIGLPLVVLFLGFLILVGYPAFTQTVTSF